MPRKKYDCRKVNVVGRFFEELTEALICCEEAPIDEGDFYIRSSNTGLEVKGSDNNHELRLPLHQIEYYTRMSGGFPLDHFFFLLFSYRNPFIKNGGPGKITSLSLYNNPVEIRNFLAANIETLFIVDIDFIPSLFAFCRVSDKSIPLHPGVKTLNIRVSYMNKVANGGWQSLVSGRDWESLRFDHRMIWSPDLLETHNLNFEIVTIGRKRRISKLIESFKYPLQGMKRVA